MSCDAARLGRTPLGIAYWLAVTALLCSNGCWHAWASYRAQACSPGVITAATIYVALKADEATFSR
jgi:hypothetical protein